MRRYDDIVQVQRGDDAPAQFLWRSRLYVVRDVLAHWVETGAWWRAPAASAVYGTGGLGAPGDVVQAPVPSGLALDQGGDRQVWRVEATRGLAWGDGVFDLCLEESTGTWRLQRTLD